MKIICYMGKTTREDGVHNSLLEGFKKHGEQVDSVDTHDTTGPTPGYDLAVFIGVRTKSRRVWDGCKEIGQQFLMLDKGYFHRSVYHRFSVNAPQPQYLSLMDHDDTRLRQVNVGYNAIVPAQRKGKADKIIYVEATQKYYSFHGLGHLSDYAEKVCGELNAILAEGGRSDLQVIYRPKASARLEKNSDLKPRQPPNTGISHPDKQPFSSMLSTAHCVVVHGSNAGVEAAAAGVPVLALGGPEANPLYDLVNTDIRDILNPKVADQEAIHKRMAQLVWCQFKDDEISSGLAWEHAKRWVKR